MEFDAFYIKLGGVDDHGCIGGTVIVGFQDDEPGRRRDVQIPFRFEANLDLPLREVREQARADALVLLRKAVRLLEEHSADQLHQVAQDAVAEQEAATDRETQDRISAALRKAVPDLPQAD